MLCMMLYLESMTSCLVTDQSECPETPIASRQQLCYRQIVINRSRVSNRKSRYFPNLMHAYAFYTLSLSLLLPFDRISEVAMHHSESGRGEFAVLPLLVSSLCLEDKGAFYVMFICQTTPITSYLAYNAYKVIIMLWGCRNLLRNSSVRFQGEFCTVDLASKSVPTVISR